MSTRAQFAQALDMIDGVTGHLYRPAVPKSGAAWPLLQSVDRDAGALYVVTWQLLIVLPQGEREASDWVDDRLADVVEALEPAGYVERVEPVEIAVDGQSRGLFGLRVTVRSE